MLNFKLKKLDFRKKKKKLYNIKVYFHMEKWDIEKSTKFSRVKSENL